jgi:hypothetical protein
MKLTFIGKLRDTESGISRTIHGTKDAWIIEASDKDAVDLISSGYWKQYTGKKPATQTWSKN